MRGENRSGGKPERTGSQLHRPGQGSRAHILQMTMFAPGWFPGGVFLVYVTVVVMIVAAVGVITGKQGFLASLVLAAMLLIFILTIHIPGLMNLETMQMAMNALSKDAGFMGGALVLVGTYRSTLISK